MHDDDPSLIRARHRALGYEERLEAGFRRIYRIRTDELAHPHEASSRDAIQWLREREREAYGRAVEDENDSPAETRRRLAEWARERGVPYA